MIGIATRWFLLWQLYDRFDFSSRFEGRHGFMRLGEAYDRYALGKPDQRNGVLPHLMDLECATFHPREIDPRLRCFLIHTGAYHMHVTTRWHAPFWKQLNHYYKQFVAPWIGNLNLPPDEAEANTVSSIRHLDIDRDEKPDFSIWERFVDGKRELFYRAAFKTYVSRVAGQERAFLAGAFPIRFPLGESQLAVVFRLENAEGGGLMYSTVAAEPARILAENEAGIYWLLPHRRSFSAFPGFGLRERFVFGPPSAGEPDLSCKHTSSFLGYDMFTLTYRIREITGPDAGA
jgi:hypothetical protein